MATSNWNLEVSEQTDAELREFLESSGAANPVSFAHFVEEAVQDRIFQEAARRAKEANANRSEEDILQAVDEALDAVRRAQ